MPQNYMGPFRATILWNEAVLLFRDGMSLGEHRHRLHKHKNSFTGYDAVSFLHTILQTNSLFDPKVTREQSCQLLKQFLKANYIAPVQNCSVNYEKCDFYDSRRYYYVYTEKLINFQRLQPLTLSNLNIQNEMDVQKKSSFLEDDNFINENLLMENIWKDKILGKLKELLHPFELENLIPEDINPKWIVTNASPEWMKLKWNTELPSWILNTFHNLFKYTSGKHKGNIYPKFEVDAFNIISDYFLTLENPLILPTLSYLFIQVFIYLDYLNSSESDEYFKQKMSYSQKNLVLAMSSPSCSANKKIHSHLLPPNSCFEAAFTSDDPTYRIVPQRSVDSIHLKVRIHQNYSENCNLNYRKSKSDELLDRKVKKQPFLKRIPFNSIDNNGKNNSCNKGIVNQGFTILSPENRVNKFEENDNLAYVNHAISFSVDDLCVLTNSDLDYKLALESVQNLVKITEKNYMYSCMSNASSSSDDDPSFHSAISSSMSNLSSSEHSSLFHHLQDRGEASGSLSWKPSTINIGVSVYQLLFMLLPPCNRAQLRYLTILIEKVSCTSPRLSSHFMLKKLSRSIVQLSNDDSCAFDFIEKMLIFIIDHQDHIFAELPKKSCYNIFEEISSKLLKKSYCTQMSEEQFEKQKTTESEMALTQLLNQISESKEISEKQKKKHLRMFKEAYPEIYHSRFPEGPIKELAKKSKRTLKNLRL